MDDEPDASFSAGVAAARQYLEPFLRHARRHHSMFGLDGSFGQFVAYLTGLDAGTGNRILDGFTDWVAYRTHDDGANVAWPALVLREAGLPRIVPWHELAADDNDRAVTMLFELLTEFVNRS